MLFINSELISILEEVNVGIKEILYFDKPDRTNSDEMVNFAKKRMLESGIKTAVIAWSSGYTVRKFMEAAKGSGLNIVTVTNPKDEDLPVGTKVKDSDNTKFKGPVSITAEIRAELEKQGVKVGYLMPDIFNLKTTFWLKDEYRAARAKMVRLGFPENVDLLDLDVGADLSPLNMISQGLRVGVGCAILAVKNGLVPEGETVVTMAGTSTAAILQVSANPRKCVIKELIGFERGRSETVGPK
jgi:hypothetical protein